MSAAKVFAAGSVQSFRGWAQRARAGVLQLIRDARPRAVANWRDRRQDHMERVYAALNASPCGDVGLMIAAAETLDRDLRAEQHRRGDGRPEAIPYPASQPRQSGRGPTGG